MYSKSIQSAKLKFSKWNLYLGMVRFQ